MIEPSTNFPHVLKCICDFDESVKYDSLKFIGYIRDLYCGRKELMDDFVIVLTELETIISSRSFSEIDLSKINLDLCLEIKNYRYICSTNLKNQAI